MEKEVGSYPAFLKTDCTMEGISGSYKLVISPATITCPLVASTSQATRERASWARHSSSTRSAMMSHSLSGCPSVTDSAV